MSTLSKNRPLSSNGANQASSSPISYTPKIGTSTRGKLIVIAVGSSELKLYDGKNFYRLRSLVSRDIPSIGTGSEKQLRVKIVDSNYSDEFAVGEYLDRQSRLVSLHQGHKGKWYAKLVLALLGYWLRNDPMSSVVLGITLPTVNMCEDVRGLLGDSHDVTVNGVRTSQHIIQLDPQPEGYGTARALAKRPDYGKATAVIDFGFQNTTVAGYDPLADQLIDAFPSNYGVSTLFKEISKAMDRTGGGPSLEAIRRGVVNRSFKLNGNSDLPQDNFQEIYYRLFESWFDARMEEAWSEGKDIIKSCPFKVFAGGGSLLPGMEEKAQEIGVRLCPEPQKTEVAGLYAHLEARYD